MKYYVYVSEQKVDMLFGQIPPNLLNIIAGKLTIDLKLLKLDFSTNALSAATLYSKLHVVEKYITEHLEVGTVESSAAYVSDTLPMRWGPFSPEDDDGLVYFGGKTDTTIVGLGGSAKHVIGAMGTSSPHSSSATPAIIKALTREITKADERGPFIDNDLVLACVENAPKRMPGPTQKMSFLAKSLKYWRAGSMGQKINVLLGSPIYVALAE